MDKWLEMEKGEKMGKKGEIWRKHHGKKPLLELSLRELKITSVLLFWPKNGQMKKYHDLLFYYVYVPT